MEDLVKCTNEIKGEIAEIFDNNRNLQNRIEILRNKIDRENLKIANRVNKFEEYLQKIQEIRQRMNLSKDGLINSRDQKRDEFDLEFQSALKNLWQDFTNKKLEIEKKKIEYSEQAKKIIINSVVNEESPNSNIESSLTHHLNTEYTNVIIISDILSCKNRCTLTDYDQFKEEILTDYKGCRYRVVLRPNGTYKRPSWGKIMGVGVRLVDIADQTLPIIRKIEIRLKNMSGGPDFFLAREEQFYKIGFFCWFYEFISLDELLGNDKGLRSKYLCDGAIQLQVLFDGR